MPPRLKRRLEQVKPYMPTLVALTIVLVVILFVSCIPWILTYLELGKLFSASPAWVLILLRSFVLALFVVPVGLVSSLLSAKIGKNRTRTRIVAALIFSLIISFSLIFSFSLVFIPQVSYAGQKIDLFVAENSNLNFEEYVGNLTLFLNNNVGKAYDKPQANLEINRLLGGTILDPYIMQIWEVTKVDVIVYQGWGSCEEAALLVGELLHRAGYETRQAFFIGIDHQWAEAGHNGTWLIIDPWYLTSNGTLVEAQYLRNLKAEFQKASGVEVQYYNGTWADASQEHGY